MSKKAIMIMVSLLLCITCAVSAYALVIVNPGEGTNSTGACGGVRVTGDAYNIWYECPLGHDNCMVQPIIYTTVGNPNETEHFHSAYHNGINRYIKYCPYQNAVASTDCLE